MLTVHMPDDHLFQLVEAIEKNGFWQLEEKYSASYSWEDETIVEGEIVVRSRGRTVIHTPTHLIVVASEGVLHRVVVDGVRHVLDTSGDPYPHPQVSDVERFKRLFDQVSRAIPIPTDAADAVPDLLRMAVDMRDPDSAREAISTLGVFGEERAIPTLQMLTEHEDPRIVVRANMALRHFADEEQRSDEKDAKREPSIVGTIVLGWLLQMLGRRR